MIRHFSTQGNLLKRYIGVTDEPLCEEGKCKIVNMNYPPVDAVFASPLMRCVETAKLIYPNQVPVFYKDFKECDFGDFENKNYLELANHPEYQVWINSGGTLPFPNGENPVDYKNRSVVAYENMVEESLRNNYKIVAMVVHGGTIMSILDRYSHPHKDYYHWQVGNGNGYVFEIEEVEGRITNICCIL